jgi:hypothetical protein
MLILLLDQFVDAFLRAGEHIFAEAPADPHRIDYHPQQQQDSYRPGGILQNVPEIHFFPSRRSGEMTPSPPPGGQWNWINRIFPR